MSKIVPTISATCICPLCKGQIVSEYPHTFNNPIVKCPTCGHPFPDDVRIRLKNNINDIYYAYNELKEFAETKEEKSPWNIIITCNNENY